VRAARQFAGDRRATAATTTFTLIPPQSGISGSVHVTEQSPPRFEIGRGSAGNKQYYQTDLCTRPEPNGEFLPWRDATYYEREDRIIVTAGCMTPLLAAGEPSARGQGLRMQLDLSAPSPNGFQLLTTTLARSLDDDSYDLHDFEIASQSRPMKV
jgi:hypothetical protein